MKEKDEFYIGCIVDKTTKKYIDFAAESKNMHPQAYVRKIITDKSLKDTIIETRKKNHRFFRIFYGILDAIRN